MARSVAPRWMRASAKLKASLISSQYAALFGITFDFANGGRPRLAQVGPPRTAFRGVNAARLQCGIAQPATADMPSPSEPTDVGCFLTRRSARDRLEVDHLGRPGGHERESREDRDGRSAHGSPDKLLFPTRPSPIDGRCRTDAGAAGNRTR